MPGAFGWTSGLLQHRGLNRNTFASPFCFGCMARVMESEVSHLGPLTCFVKGLCIALPLIGRPSSRTKTNPVPAIFSTFECLQSCFISSRIVRTVSVCFCITCAGIPRCTLFLSGLLCEMGVK